MTTNACWIGLSLAVLVIAAPAGAGEISATQEGSWRCNSIQASPTAPLYVSERFEARAARDDVYAAFQKILIAKYGVTSQVSCSMAYNGPGVSEKRKADDLRWYKQIRASGGRVVETGWTYGAKTQTTSAAARPDSSPVADETPAAVKEKIYQCWMGSFGNNYMTRAFASSKGHDALSADWRAYITKAHLPTGPAQIDCMEMDPKQASSNLAQRGYTQIDWED